MIVAEREESPASSRVGAGRLLALGTRLLARDGLVLLALLLAALAAMWPVLANPRSWIIGIPGDNIQYVYMTGWVGQSLLLRQSPLVDPRLNFPGTLELPSTDAPFLSMLLVAPATWLGGPIFGYNLIILGSGLLSGYAAYLWVRQISGSRFGGLVAGLAFLLAPFRIAASYGHLQAVSTQGLPFFYWALDTAARRAQLRLRHLLALAGATILLGAGSQYYLLIGLLTGIAYLLALYADGWRSLIGVLRSRPLALLLRMGATALAVLLGALISALPYLLVWQAGGFSHYSWDDLRRWSANPTDFLLPSIIHPLWGALVTRWFPQPDWIVRTLYLGVVPLALAVVALWRRGGRDDEGEAVLPARPYLLVWPVVALVGALLALGTDLHWNNQPIQPDTPFYLPAAYLTQLPFTSLMRVWTRFAIVPILFVALLGGLGAAWLQKVKGKRQKVKYVLPAFVIALLLIDLLPGNIQVGGRV